MLGRWSAGQGSLRHKLIVALMDAVRLGGLAPGVRLPSERELAAALSVSRTTVVAAYDALREAGWFESRHGSGTWVREGSLPLALARNAAQAAALAGSSLPDLVGQHARDDLVRLPVSTGRGFGVLTRAAPAAGHVGVVHMVDSTRQDHFTTSDPAG